MVSSETHYESPHHHIAIHASESDRVTSTEKVGSPISGFLSAWMKQKLSVVLVHFFCFVLPFEVLTNLFVKSICEVDIQPLLLEIRVSLSLLRLRISE